MKKVAKWIFSILTIPITVLVGVLLTLTIKENVNPNVASANSAAYVEFEKQIDELSAQLRKSESQLDETKTQVQQTNDEIARIEKFLEQYENSNVEELQAVLQEKESELERLQQQNNELSEQLEKALTQDDKKEIEAKINSNTEQIQNLEFELNNIKKIITEGKSAVENFKQTLPEKEQELNSLLDSVSALREKIQGLQQQIDVFGEQVRMLDSHRVTDMSVKKDASWVTFGYSYCIQWGYGKTTKNADDSYSFNISLPNRYNTKDYVILTTVSYDNSVYAVQTVGARVNVSTQDLDGFSGFVTVAITGTILPPMTGYVEMNFYWLTVGELDARVSAH